MYRTACRFRRCPLLLQRRSINSKPSPATPPEAASKARADSSTTRTSSINRGPITWKTLALFTGVGTGVLAYYSLEKQRRMEEITKPRTIGRAAIGGAFELIDGDGKVFSETELLGKWSLIYFGFTMCPDICPAELSKLSEALEILEKKGRKVWCDGGTLQPVFISVDPGRDSAEKSSEYAKGFHRGFIGLSGSEEQVRRAAKAYRVYYSRDDGKDDEYLVDHSIITYLMDPSGEFREFYGKNSSAVEIAGRIEQQMLGWKR